MSLSVNSCKALAAVYVVAMLAVYGAVGYFLYLIAKALIKYVG